MTKRFFARKKGNVVIPIPPEPPTVEVAGGWADLHPDGAVTGGNGGDVLYFNESSSVNGKLSFEALWETLALNPKTPLTLIWTGGDYVMETKNYFIGGVGATATPTNRPENKTIMGSSGQTLEGGGGLYLASWKNIILRNFRKTGDGLGGDSGVPHGGKGMALRGSERIWIDHMEFDGEATIGGTEQIKDGSADQGDQTDFVTYSNCYFRRSDKTSLISGSDTSFADRGKLKITFRNCLWENNHQRQPLMRFGQVHMYNNVFRYDPVFTASLTQYPWARIHQIGAEAQLYIQNNKYYGHRYFLRDNGAELAEPLSGVVSVGNWFDPNPAFSSFTNGAGVFYKGVGSLRPENVSFNPNTIVGYNFPVPLMTPDEAEVYVNQWAGAKYHLKNPVV